MNELRAKIYSTFQDAETRWRHYETLHDHYVYQTFDWTVHWYDTIGRHRGITLCLVDVSDDVGTPLAFLPLAIERRMFGFALIWLGGDISDYHGPILTCEGSERLDHQALSQLWKILRQRHPVVAYADFHRQPASIGKLPNPFFQVGGRARSERALGAELAGDWPTYYAAKRSKKTRHNDRRKRRRLESMGALSFVIATTPAEVETQITAMLAQKDRYVARIGKINCLQQRGHNDFLKRLASDRTMKGRTLLCALRLDDQIIAVQWGVLHRKRFFSIVASYDDGPLSRYSTGDILLRELLAWCCENDVEVVDFTCGDEPYKLAWCDQSLDLQDRLLPLSLVGHLCVGATLFLMVIRRWAKSSETLRGAVAAVRSRALNGAFRRRPAQAAMAIVRQARR